MSIQRTLVLCVTAFAASTAVAVAAPVGVITSLKHIATIGSTVDPINGDQNPYGLTVAPAGGTLVAAGDLVVCNFNDALNIQGLGTTLEVLKPVIGAKPKRLIADPRLTGCAAIAMGGSAPWVAALDANDNPIVSGGGTFLSAINNYPWTGPWGQAFAGASGWSAAAFYESNANDGSIVRINLTSPFTFEKIVTGFSVNHGVPGSILAPSGLTYDSKRDVLYIVDGNANRVVAIDSPENIHTGGIVVKPAGFGGPSAASAHVVFAGSPLAAPISAALLFNGHLVVGNTRNNGLVEIAPGIGVVGERPLDSGAPGALFGIAATGTSVATTRIYYNDDNTNTVRVLMP
jgi:hypothetical protein